MSWNVFLVMGGFVPAVLFIAVYLRSPWWRTPIGQNIMVKMFILAGLLGLSLASMLWPVPVWAWRTGMGLLDIAIWWRLIILFKLQNEEEEEE